MSGTGGTVPISEQLLKGEKEIHVRSSHFSWPLLPAASSNSKQDTPCLAYFPLTLLSLQESNAEGAAFLPLSMLYHLTLVGKTHKNPSWVDETVKLSNLAGVFVIARLNE